jgi:peptide/nickel transport system substrate-binding protein
MIRRTCFLGGPAALLLGLGLAWLPGPDTGLRAQPGPKKVREEEEEPTKVPKKVEEIEPKGGPPPAATPAPPPPGSFNIAAEAAKARKRNLPQPVQDLLLRASIPYDNLISATGRTYKIGLLAERKLPDGKFTYLELNATLSGGKEKELPTGAGFSLQPYEEIVLEGVNNLLTRKIEGMRRDEVVELAVQVLQATRRFHAAAVEQKKRVGRDWEAVDEALRRRIVQLRRDQLREFIKARDWRRADDLSLELSAYADDPEAQKDIYRLLLQKALEALRADRDEDYIALRDAAAQFETIGGGRGEPMAQSARRVLAARAQRYVDEANALAEQGQNAGAFGRLKNADALDPDSAAAARLRAKLRERILYVGVSRLPERMTPATARTDADRWAVELLFESLLQSVPDPEIGRRYRPVLAAGPPALVPLGREFALVRNARWAGDGGRPVDARDVFGTLDLLRKIPFAPCAEGLDVLDADKVRLDDPYKLKIGFKQGCLEPLGRTTFKVLPARYLKAQGKGADDAVFAQQPFGSGPYVYAGKEKERDDREVAVFKANRAYGQRPGRFGLPTIGEIRFLVPNPSTAAADIAFGQLHLLLDVPTADLARYRDDPISAGLVKVATTAVNRRIWMLAVNHAHDALRNPDLRRGLAAAIDREAILIGDAFRPGGIKTHHRALSGPFPPNSWATPDKARAAGAALHNKALAGGLLASAAGGGKIGLTLKYPADDARARFACGEIKRQVEEAARKTPGDPPCVEITPVAVPPEEFFGRLGFGLDYQLAYYSFDYRDDIYWLGGLLDRAAAVNGGRNFLNYLAEGTTPQAGDNELRLALEEVRAHRDFRDKVREGTWKVHAKFLERMPFIPLWQLDRHLVIHQALETHLDEPGDRFPPERLDPAMIFTGVEFWRLK